MKAFVVRLNPDTRSCEPYTQYPTIEEYKKIHKSSPMNGFHEAVNFKSENGVIRGYLPPKHLASMRDGEAFLLITITAKTAKIDGDLIVGIQAGCKYVGETLRAWDNSKEIDLAWHYTCPESLSLLLDEPVPNARAIILGDNSKWVRGPTFQLNNAVLKRVLDQIKLGIKTEKGDSKYQNIKKLMQQGKMTVTEEIEAELSFSDKVKQALNKDLKDIKGNKIPSQKEVRSFQYERDPKVVAFVLKASQGICFDCKNKGPFISKTTGIPYLEVHHVVMLKNGGEDTVENAV
ncbi:MAG: HNH endonuclease, partial [Gammaproteobacteria bacterium]